jgi:hypothetical protein
MLPPSRPIIYLSSYENTSEVGALLQLAIKGEYNPALIKLEGASLWARTEGAKKKEVGELSEPGHSLHDPPPYI